MRIITSIAVALVLTCLNSTVRAGSHDSVGGAVAQDQDRNDIAWAIETGRHVVGATQEARRRLEADGHRKTTSRDGEEFSVGTTVRYCVITGRANGRLTIGIGFGRSKDEAERDAVACLKRANWSWSTNDGYDKIRLGTIEL